MHVMSSLWHAALRQLRLLAVLVLGYLFQVCVMPYFSYNSVTPSLIYPLIAIVTVGYGRIRAFWVGAFYGIILETMAPTIELLNMALYPVSALFCSVFFADKSETRLEYERSIGKPGRNASPYLRTLGCCALNVLIYEIVNVFYMYLGGSTLTVAMFGRSLINILYSTLLALLIVWPVRRFLGFRRPAVENPAAMRFGYRKAP